MLLEIDEDTGRLKGNWPFAALNFRLTIDKGKEKMAENEKEKPLVVLQLLKDSDPLRVFTLEDLRSFTVGTFLFLFQEGNATQVSWFSSPFSIFKQDLCALMTALLEQPTQGPLFASQLQQGVSLVPSRSPQPAEPASG